MNQASTTEELRARVDELCKAHGGIETGSGEQGRQWLLKYRRGLTIEVQSGAGSKLDRRTPGMDAVAIIVRFLKPKAMGPHSIAGIDMHTGILQIRLPEVDTDGGWREGVTLVLRELERMLEYFERDIPLDVVPAEQLTIPVVMAGSEVRHE